MAEAPDDLTLFERWRDGDEVAGNELFGRYFDSLFRFFRSKVRDGADDLVQQSFLACVRNAERFRGDTTFRAYLFMVARTKLYDHLRVRRRKRDPIDFTQASIMDIGPSPSRWAAEQEEHGKLQRALQRLPVELQVAIEMFYFESMTAGEVAAVLEIPQGTVRSRVRRGLEKLKVELAREGAADDSINGTVNILQTRMGEG